jgi:Fe-S-cluster-containing hydrogenase component 2
MGLHLGADPTRCSGCRYCELWCSYKHEGVFSPYFSRIKVVKDDLEKIDFPLTCQDCEDAPCAKVCPTGTIQRDESTGVLKVIEDLCIGCGNCVSACPYGYLSLNPRSLKPLLCDLCSGVPECVKRCPTNALFLTKERLPTEYEMKDRFGKDHAIAMLFGGKYKRVKVV